MNDEQTRGLNEQSHCWIGVGGGAAQQRTEKTHSQLSSSNTHYCAKHEVFLFSFLFFSRTLAHLEALIVAQDLTGGGGGHRSQQQRVAHTILSDVCTQGVPVEPVCVCLLCV